MAFFSYQPWSDNNTGIQIFALICMLILTLALLVLSIISIVCTIIGCVKYFSGKTYKIPFSIPIIKIKVRSYFITITCNKSLSF